MSDDRRAVLQQQQAQLIAYAQMKMIARDWHGVADAAMDLREVEARLDELLRLEELGYTKDSPVLQAVLDAISGKLDPSTQIADHPNVKFAQAQRTKLLQEGAAEAWGAYQTQGRAVPAAAAVTPVPQCGAPVGRDRCVMVAGHQGDHMNADMWRSEAH